MEIEKAFKKLLIKQPFYGLFCLNLPKVVTTKFPTLAVSKQGVNCQLNINPDFWQKHTDDEQIALLTHELMHICLQHMFISSSFADAHTFNMAADTEVNSYIENLPQSALTVDVINQKLGTSLTAGQGTKTYYEAIMNPPQQKNQQSSSTPSQSSSSPSQANKNSASQPSEPAEKETPPSPSQGNSESPVDTDKKQYPDSFGEVEMVDDHSTWKEFSNLPEANKQLMINTINSVLKQTAEQVRKGRGTIPGELQEIITKLETKKPEVFNWKAYFRRLLGSIYDVAIRSTRRKESKRFAGNAGIQHKKKVSILVAIDTSGSVSVQELQEFFSEIDYVYKAGARVTIIECDSTINDIVEYDGKHIPEIKGRGGTDFNPPVDYYKKHIKDYASLIYFTDGEAPMPDSNPAGMVWVISSRGRHQEYPGKTIYIPNTDK